MVDEILRFAQNDRDKLQNERVKGTLRSRVFLLPIFVPPAAYFLGSVVDFLGVFLMPRLILDLADNEFSDLPLVGLG